VKLGVWWRWRKYLDGILSLLAALYSCACQRMSLRHPGLLSTLLRSHGFGLVAERHVRERGCGVKTAGTFVTHAARRPRGAFLYIQNCRVPCRIISIYAVWAAAHCLFCSSQVTCCIRLSAAQHRRQLLRFNNKYVTLIAARWEAAIRRASVWQKRVRPGIRQLSFSAMLAACRKMPQRCVLDAPSSFSALSFAAAEW